MRPIKFRGKARDGKIIHSDSIKFEEIDGADISFPYLLDKENDVWIEILSDSVAQLVGYDADNAEVYEGDVLIDGEGHEYIATLDSMLLWTKDPNLKYWHLPFNQSDDEDLPTSSNKMLWDFYKNCCEKMTKTEFIETEERVSNTYEVKFRGKSAITGKIIYGIGVKEYPDYTMMILDCLVGEEVEPDSLAQFVGYDKNGKEMYSNDKIIEQFLPELFPMKRIAGDRIPANRFGEKFDVFELVNLRRKITNADFERNLSFGGGILS